MAVAYSASSTTARDDAAAATFTVKRSGTAGEIAQPSSIAFQTADVTARASIDYVATSGTLEFAGGAVDATVDVMVLKEAYDSATSTTFLLSIGDFGTASGTIVANPTSNTTQSFLYLPEDNDSVIVPTADNPSPDGQDNLVYQAVYAGFSDPDEPSVDMPLAYLRIGHARADMNEYERVVVNSDAYVPEWNGYDADGTPREVGSLIHMMLPRGVSRKGLSDQQVQDEMADNAHLDGVFLYADKNYVVTVGNHMNEVVQGDRTTYVGGEVRANFMGPESRWTYMDGPDCLRWAEGTDIVNGDVWNYSLSKCLNLGINGDTTIDYRLGPSFSASASADMSISNALKYEVSNSIGMEVTGISAGISCNVLGEYEVKLPGFSRAGTQADFSQEAVESISLTVNPGLASARLATVSAVAGMNAAAALAATTAGWILDFAPDGSFYRNVNAEQLSDAYNAAFTDDVPNTMAGLAAMSATVIMLTAMQQKAEEVAPAVTPKLEMNAAEITLSCGPTVLVISEAGVMIAGPLLDCAVDNMDVNADAISMFAPNVRAATGSFSISGSLSVGIDLEVSGDAEVMGELYGTLVDSG